MTAGSRRRLGVGALLAALGLAATPAAVDAQGIGLARETFIDPSRPTKASPPFAGAPDRRLDTWIWYPAAGGGSDPEPDAAPRPGGPWPLIVYSHGTYSRPDAATHLCEHLARHGYVVAAPAFPLTSSVAHTELPAADISDAGSQPGDVTYVIDSLLAHPRYGPLIDADRIGATGISLGGITTYFLSFGIPTRDARIKASAPIAGGDPPYAALSFGLGFNGVVPAPVSTPALLLVGDADVFEAQTGGPAAAVRAPPAAEAPGDDSRRTARLVRRRRRGSGGRPQPRLSLVRAEHRRPAAAVRRAAAAD